MDNFIHWIAAGKRYPSFEQPEWRKWINFIRWIATYPVDKTYPLFEQPGPGHVDK